MLSNGVFVIHVRSQERPLMTSQGELKPKGGLMTKTQKKQNNYITLTSHSKQCEETLVGKMDAMSQNALQLQDV